MIMMEQDEVEAHQVDLDLEPQSRPRSCTWPLRCPDHSPCVPELNGDLSLNLAVFKVEPDNVPSSCRLSRRRMLDAGGLHGLAGSALDVAGQLRKTKSSRRNAWGNQSYAELITRAIESTPDKRLTLSQIYDWMVRYVPYFKDKGDSNSSAGWKNSIRHNLSLHTRFIRVQNEGTGKSSWWMLNPEGGKAGKAPRRRAASMDNSTKYLKTKGRVSRKRTAGKSTQGGGLVPAAQVEFCSSPEHCSPPRKLRTGVAVVREEFEVWTDLHSCASSSASLSGRLSPILAEGEQVEPEDGRMSCSTSPHLYPSPSSIHSPASHCPADLRALLSLEDFYQQPHNHPSYHYNSKSKGQGSTCGPVHGLSGVGVIHHHSTMQTIQENKATRFSGSKQSYSGTSTLQSLLTRGPQFCVNDMILKKEMIASNNRVDSSSHHHNHSNNQYHSQICSSNISFKSFHSHNTIQSLSQESVHSLPSGGHMQPYVNKANYIYSPTAHAHLPASTTLPPNPAGVKGISQDTSHLATAPHRHPSTYTDPHNMTDGPYHQPQGAAGGYHNFHHPNQLYPHERLPADLDMDIFYNSLDCDMESILLHDFLDSGEEIDFNFDASLVQGMGIGFGQQNHSKQSWVPG